MQDDGKTKVVRLRTSKKERERENEGEGGGRGNIKAEMEREIEREGSTATCEYPLRILKQKLFSRLFPDFAGENFVRVSPTQRRPRHVLNPKTHRLVRLLRATEQAERPGT